MKKREYKKILIIRFGAIGDVVNSLVIHQAIKRKHPDVVIHYLTLDYIAPLLENDPQLEKVFYIEDKKKKNLFYIAKIGLQLRKERYDAIISLSNSIRNKLINLCANPKIVMNRGITHRYGHSEEAFLNSANGLFNDLELPERVILYPDDSIKEQVYSRIKNYPKPFIFFNPGGAHDKERKGRIWPAKYWIETGNKLVEKYGGTVFIVGSKSERESHKPLLSIKNSVLFSGEFSLKECCSLYKYSDIFLSVDSGPLHIAAALGVKSLSIMGSTKGTSCGPFGSGDFIDPPYDCSGCNNTKCSRMLEGQVYAPCISAIKPDMVLKKIETMYSLPCAQILENTKL